MKQITIAILLCTACDVRSPAPPRVGRDYDLEAYEQAVKWPSPAPTAVMTLAQMYLSSGRYEDGYAYFSARSDEAPEYALFVALEGLFQVRMNEQIALLERIAWVEDGMAKLDRAVDL